MGSQGLCFMKERQRVCGPAMVTGDHRGLGEQKQSFLPGAVCFLWAGVSMLPGKRGDPAFIHSSFSQASTHPSILPSTHPPLPMHPSILHPLSIHPSIHSFSTLHPSILLEMLLSTYCA